MKKHLKILMAGALIVAPLAITIAVICWIGGKIGDLGLAMLQQTGLLQQIETPYQPYAPWAGVLAMLVVVYLIGLLANFWFFGRIFGLADKLLSRLPGIKTIYESMRDLMKLFGGGAKGIGHAVLYAPPGTNMKMLGVVTNEHPAGLGDEDDRVIVYLPMGYMIGGPIVYASPNDIEPLDMPVETALKLAATAFVGVNDQPDGGTADATGQIQSNPRGDRT